MAIYRIARYTVRPETIDACKEAAPAVVAETKEHEPATLMYMVMQEAENPTNFIHFSAYTDEAALTRHINGELMQKLIREVFTPAMVEPPTFIHYTVVDAKMPSNV